MLQDEEYKMEFLKPSWRGEGNAKSFAVGFCVCKRLMKVLLKERKLASLGNCLQMIFKYCGLRTQFTVDFYHTLVPVSKLTYLKLHIL